GKISYLTLIRAIVITLVSAAAYAGTIFLQSKQWLRPTAVAEPDGDLQVKGMVSRPGLAAARR
ncbi:MAG: hypothetical protein JW741_24045, partial [Sedimentisphaerales bacterium]|nr:hypothetical protein [Sedimentisphaerales bacterium]